MSRVKELTAGQIIKKTALRKALPLSRLITQDTVNFWNRDLFFFLKKKKIMDVENNEFRVIFVQGWNKNY